MDIDMTSTVSFYVPPCTAFVHMPSPRPPRISCKVLQMSEKVVVKLGLGAGGRAV